jgi:membrane-associated phospholipid phosphatase
MRPTREASKVGAVHSFPAGHTLSVFALTSAAGTIASMRRYALVPLIWIAGSMLGVTASYLRIAADQHYFTATLAGAAIGVAVGAGVPWLFHPPVASGARASWLRRATLTTQPTLSGRTVSFAVAF